MDATDGLSRPQREDMWSRIRPVAEDAPAGSRFHLFEVGDEARLAASIQRPPHACEVSHWNDNPDQRRAQWANSYLRPLRDALGALSRAAPSDSSPIAQAVHAAARRFDDAPEAERRLILVSDLIQNARADFYRGVPDFARFRESALFGDVRTRLLEGATVTVMQLPPQRDGLADEAALRRFWTDYFADQGAEAEFVRLEGPRASQS